MTTRSRLVPVPLFIGLFLGLAMVACDSGNPSEPSVEAPEPPGGEVEDPGDPRLGLIWEPAEADANVTGLPATQGSVTADGLLRFDLGTISFGDDTNRSLTLTFESPAAAGPHRLECLLVADFRGDDQPEDEVRCNLFDQNYAPVGDNPRSFPGSFVTNRAEYHDTYLELPLVPVERYDTSWGLTGGGSAPAGVLGFVAWRDAADGPVTALPVERITLAASATGADGNQSVNAFGTASAETIEGIQSLIEDIDPVLPIA